MICKSIKGGSNIRKIVYGCIIIVLILCCICFKYDSIDLKGKMKENNEIYNVNIDIGIHNIIKKVPSRVIISSDDEQIIAEYIIKKPLYDKDEQYNFMSLYRFYGEGQYEQGYIYFDKTLKNVVIIIDERKIYAAEDKFIEMIQHMQ